MKLAPSIAAKIKVDRLTEDNRVLKAENERLRRVLADLTRYVQPRQRFQRSTEKADKVLAALAGCRTPETALTRREVLARCTGMSYHDVSNSLSNLEARKLLACAPKSDGGRQRFYVRPT